LKSGKKKSGADRAMLLTKKEQKLIAREKALEKREKAAFAIGRTKNEPMPMDIKMRALVREQENRIDSLAKEKEQLKKQLSASRQRRISDADSNVHIKKFEEKVQKIESALGARGIKKEPSEDQSEEIITIRQDQLSKLNMFADSLSMLETQLREKEEQLEVEKVSALMEEKKEIEKTKSRLQKKEAKLKSMASKLKKWTDELIEKKAQFERNPAGLKGMKSIAPRMDIFRLKQMGEGHGTLL